jgi:hypothetical protein
MKGKMMSKQFAIIPLNFDVLTFSDKSLEKYRQKIGMVSVAQMDFSETNYVVRNLRIIEQYLLDYNSYFLVPMGENQFVFLLKSNLYQFVDTPDCEFSITRRE